MLLVTGSTPSTLRGRPARGRAAPTHDAVAATTGLVVREDKEQPGEPRFYTRMNIQRDALRLVSDIKRLSNGTIMRMSFEAFHDNLKIILKFPIMQESLCC